MCVIHILGKYFYNLGFKRFTNSKTIVKLGKCVEENN